MQGTVEEEKTPRRRGSFASMLSSSAISRDKQRSRGKDQQAPTTIAATRRPSILSKAFGTLSNSNQPTASTSKLPLPPPSTPATTLQTPIYRSLARATNGEIDPSTPISLSPPTPTQSTFNTWPHSALRPSSSQLSRPSSSYSLDIVPNCSRSPSARSTPSHSIHASSPSLEAATTNGQRSSSSSSNYSTRNGRPISNVFPSSPSHSPSSSSLSSSPQPSPSPLPTTALPSTSRLPFTSYAFPVNTSQSPPALPARPSCPEPDIDIFVGPAPTTLAFDRRTGTYVSATAGAVPVSVQEMDDLVASIGGGLSAINARRRSSGTSSGRRGRRTREASEDTSASLGGMGPQAVPMDRDPTTMRRSEGSPGMGAVQDRAEEAVPSIEDIIRAYTTDGILRPSVSTPILSRGLSADPDSGTGRRASLTETSPFLPPPPVPPKSHIKSIDEIIREHSPSLPLRQSRKSSLGSSPTPAQALAASARSREPTYESDHSRSSTDSVGEEIYAALAHDRAKVLHHSKSFPSRPPTSSSYLPPLPTPSDDRSDPRSLYSNPTTPRQGSPPSFEPDALATERELAHLLKSPRLTRLLTLRRSPNTGLTASLADVGRPDGHPVLVFLGLGCVRYLIALYDELAIAFGLRLICVDRWGLGRTSEVPDAQRGFLEWASVVEEVAEQMGLERYALLAHSAGGPYALATALREPRRVVGAIHLLAPWVGTSVDSLAGAYKYIKFVPSGLLRTAQVAEWKVRCVVAFAVCVNVADRFYVEQMQSWRLGKPPTIVHAPVGYDKRAGISSSDEPRRPSLVLSDVNAKDVKVDEDEYDRMSEYGSVRSGESGSTIYPAGKVAVNGRPLRAKSSFLGGLFGSNAEGGKTIKRSASYSSASTSNGRLPLPHTSTPPSTFSRSSSSSKTPTRRSSTISSSSSGPSSSGLSSSTPPCGSSSRNSLYSSTSYSPTLTPTSLSGNDLANGLLRASHAESLRGGTSDLMLILERTSKPWWGFKYSDVKTPVRVWHGDKDERISLSSVRCLEQEMEQCVVTVVEGADHSLMTSKSLSLSLSLFYGELADVSCRWSSND